MSKFLNDLLATQKEKEPVKCPVGRWLKDPDTDNAAKDGIREALKTPKIYAGTIAEVVGTTEKAVAKHRRKTCSCEKRGIK